VAITSHYGYIEQLHKNIDHNYYMPIFNGFKLISNSDKCYIFALSQGIKDTYIKNGMNPDKIYVTPNGAREDLFNFRKDCIKPNESICVGKVENRKRQELILQYGSNVYFAGNLATGIDFNNEWYLGEWSKETLYSHLTDYANLVLLSNGEADPLVVKEALMAGLGVVISEYATANLDLSQPFISVVSEMQIRNKSFVKYVIEENRKKSISMRNEIRQYAIDNFGWSKLVKNYVELIEKI
jgi:glycosyltransferase involved in cell wall biosynthesis